MFGRIARQSESPPRRVVSVTRNLDDSIRTEAPMRQLLSLGTLLAVLAGFALAAPAAPHALAATADVSVQDNLYTPGTVTINVGDTVHWTWTGLNSHTVTATDSSFDSGSPQTSGTFDHTFSTAGTFTYLCQVHGTAMSGTVVVQQAAAPTSTTQPAAATATSAPASTSTTAPGSTMTPLAAVTSTARAASSPSVTTAARTPTTAAVQAGAAGAGTQLPRSGTGGAGGAPLSSEMLLVVLALTGAGSIVVAFVVRRQA
jgi:plastocyanin